MQHIAALHELRPCLANEMDLVIAQRPEWRFLEQKKHLKDVIRLLLRETQSHAHHFESALFASESHRQTALTNSWLSLLIAQEMQHPPQLTQQAFTHCFYTTLISTCQGKSQPHVIQHSSEQSLKMLEASVSQESSDMLRMTQLLCCEMRRIHEQHFADKPWSHMRQCLFFLNHKVHINWLSQMAELMQLLQDSDMPSATTMQTGFCPEQLEADHPLRLKAQQEIAFHKKTYSELHAKLCSNHQSLGEFLEQQAQKCPVVRHINTAIEQMREAWNITQLIAIDQDWRISQAQALFAEADYQRYALGSSLTQARQVLQANASSQQDKQCCDLIELLFTL